MTPTERIAEIRARFELFKTKQMWLTNSTMAQDLQFLLDEAERLSSLVNMNKTDLDSERNESRIFKKAVAGQIVRLEKALERAKEQRKYYLSGDIHAEQIARDNDAELEKILSGREG